MTFFGDFLFFFCMALVLLPAVVLGLRGKPLGPYGLLASLVLLLAALAQDVRQLCWLLGYLLLEVALVQLYLRLRSRFGRVGWHYALCLALSVLPVFLAKLSEVTPLHLFQFIGVSYLTFRTAQVIIEIYDGLIQKVPLAEFLAFLLFFPTLSSGPIDRSRRFQQDYHRVYTREEYLDLVGDGLQKLLVGLVYKFVFASLAYRLLSPADPKANVWLALGYAYAYGIYMFFDFAGYSRMAVGAAYLLGVRTPDNFDKPFVSHDVKEFWNRWHITLSQWLRDYLFSRLLMRGIKGKWFPDKLTGACCAFLVNMLVMGAWHGFALYYLLYGLYHGVLLALTEVYQKKSSFYKKHKQDRWYRALSWFVTLNFVMFGFLLFSGKLIG